jgi:hypothetical protein
MLNSSLLQKLPQHRVSHSNTSGKPLNVSHLSQSLPKESVLTNQLFNRFVQMVKEEMEEHEDFYKKERSRLGIKLQTKQKQLENYWNTDRFLY